MNDFKYWNITAGVDMQSVSVTADVHQYVAQDNGLGLQVHSAADESDSKHDTARQ